MIFFCKIIEFLYPHHPDRRDVSLKYRLFKSALWVAPSANAKNFNILQRKKSYDASFRFELLIVSS